MRRRLCITAVLIALNVVAGCSIEGEWKTVRVAPERLADAFAFTAVTFDDEGFYLATVTRGDRQTNPRGKYEWNAWTGRLEVKPREGEPRTYRIRFRAPGRAVFVLRGEHGVVRGVMQRVDEE